MTDEAKPTHRPLDPVPPYIPVKIEDEHRLHPGVVDFTICLGLTSQLVPLQWLHIATRWKPGLVYIFFFAVTVVSIIRFIVKWSLRWKPQPWAYMLAFTASIMNLSDHLAALPQSWLLIKLSGVPLITITLSVACWHALYEQTGHPWRQPVR